MYPIPNDGQRAVTRPVIQPYVRIVSFNVGCQSLREQAGVSRARAVVRVFGQQYPQYPRTGSCSGCKRCRRSAIMSA